MESPALVFTNPATGEKFGQLAMTTPESISRAYRDLRVSARIWAQKPVKERVQILKRLQEAMIDSLDEITEVITNDCGKSRQDSLIEVFMTVDMLSQYCTHANRWLRRRRVSSGLYITKRSYIEYRPYGVVAVIAPWNYPFALSLPPTLAALLAGNTVLLKPSEVTAATGLMIEKLINMVPELSPFIKVVHGDSTVGEMVVQGKPDYIFLTGSTATGKKVSLAAAERLIPLTCELGGKDAMIVLEDADLDSAARWGVWGAFFNSGQTCMGVERVYIVEALYEAFIQKVVSITNELRVGYTADRESPYYMGPITDPRQVIIIRQHLEDAIAKGAQILTGGGIEGMFVEPTILIRVAHDMLVMQEETFGPLMPIMMVKDEAEAIRMANDCSLGLGASIWSADINRAERVAYQVEASSIIINDTIAQFAIPLLPFGGIKQSGYGRVHGKEGLMQFTRPYSYVTGEPPASWDIATIMRNPHHYQTGSAIIHFIFGNTPRQRSQSVLELARGTAQKIQKRSTTAGLGTFLLSAIVAGCMILWFRNPSKTNKPVK